MGEDVVTRVGWDNSAAVAGAAEYEQVAKRSQKRVEAALGGQGSLGKVFEGLRPGIAALTAGLSVGALKEFVDEFGRLDDLAKQLDQSPEALQRLGMMAKVSGTDLEGVAKGLNRVNKELAAGENVGVFETLGIDVREFLAMEADRQVIALAEAFQRAEKDGKGLHELYELFGKSAAELLPLLREGADQLKRFSETPVVTEEQVAALAEFGDKWDALVLRMKAGGASGFLSGVEDMKIFLRALNGEGQGGDLQERLASLRQAVALEQQRAKVEADAARAAKREASAKEGVLKAQQEAEKKAAEERGKAEKKLAEQRERLGQETERTREATLTDLQLWEKLMEDILKLEEEVWEAGQRKDEGASLESAIELERSKQRLLDLEKRIADQQQRQDQETARRLLKEAELRQDKREGLQALLDEMRVMDLRAKGRDKEAAALERELDIAREAKRIREETGLSEQKALEKARQRAKLEEDAAKRQDGRRRIRGYTQSQGAARGFGGLAEFDANQRKGPLVPANTRGLDELKRLQDRKEPAFLKQRAQKNAEKDEKAGAPQVDRGMARLEDRLLELKEEVVRLGG
jgi:hypothetical protein